MSGSMPNGEADDAKRESRWENPRRMCQAVTRLRDIFGPVKPEGSRFRSGASEHLLHRVASASLRPPMNREKLLEAAMRVFAESGFRGATTRRIAEAAGVNEVTLFRHFKSKSALISEAAQLYAQQGRRVALPAAPTDPTQELVTWCTGRLAHLRESRALIRKFMAELEEHPDMGPCLRYGPAAAHEDLRAYAAQLRRRYGLADSTEVVNAACTMLMGSMFADAMGRDLMPEMFPQPERRAPVLYTRLFLRALGMPNEASRVGPSIRRARGAARA